MAKDEKIEAKPNDNGIITNEEKARVAKLNAAINPPKTDGKKVPKTFEDALNQRIEENKEKYRLTFDGLALKKLKLELEVKQLLGGK